MQKKIRFFIILFAVLFSLVVSAVPIGSLGGSIGANIRSDESYLYMTMENGILPYFEILDVDADCHETIDANNTIEGKFCLNITKTGAVEGDLKDCYFFDKPIRPTTYSYKIKLHKINNNGYLSFFIFQKSNTFVATELRFRNETGYAGKIRITNLGAYQNFTEMEPWRIDCIYTLTLSDIVYRNASATQSHLYTATLSNATDSQTIYNLQMQTTASIYGKNQPLFGWYINSVALVDGFQYSTVFIDDWTVGTQSKIESYAATNVEETTATVSGELFNDGSPLQNSTESKHTVRFLYDNESHPVNYTYYFNESDSVYADNWTVNPRYMNDSSEYTYASTNNSNKSRKRPISGDKFTTVLSAGSWGLTFDNNLGSYAGVRGSTTATWCRYNFSNNKITNFTIYAEHPDPGSSFIIDQVNVSENGVWYDAWNGTQAWTSASGLAKKSFVLNRSYIVHQMRIRMRTTVALDNTAFYNIIFFGVNNSKLLMNHTGNTASTPADKNITKVELRAKTNLSSNACNGKIVLQPVFNTSSINGSTYNIFSHADASGDWSDWVDITNDSAAPSNWNWSNITRLKCRVIANLTNGVAYCGKVEIRVTVQPNYSFNKTITGLHANTSTTDTFLENISSLSIGKLYCYRTYINTSYRNSSSYSYSDEHYFLTKPQNNTNPKTKTIGTSRVNFSWTKGVGANRTVLISKEGSYPSALIDGTVLYNGTGTYLNMSVTLGKSYYVRSWSYTNWTLSGGTRLAHFSDNHTDFNFSSIGFNCFNESKPSQAIPFGIEISNPDGSFVYTNHSCTNTHYVNISNISAGGTVFYIIVNSTGYRTRSRYETIYNNTVLNMSFYLPPVELPPGEGEPGENYTRIYRIRVIDQKTDPLADVYTTIKRYINTTDSYETISTFYTNGYGEYDLWLIPSTSYKVFLTKDGYDNVIGAVWLTDPTFWGANYPKIFQMTSSLINITIPPDFYNLIRFNGTMFTNGSIFVDYMDSLSETVNAQFYTYEVYNFTNTLIDTQSIIGVNDYQYWVTGINASRQHIITVHVNHTTLGWVNESIYLNPVNNSLYHDPGIVEDALTDVTGPFELGYVRFFIEWLPFIAILVILGRVEAGMGIFVGALYLALIGKFFNDLPAELWQVIPIIIIFAALWYIVTKGKFRL